MLPPVRVCVVAVACLWLALGQVDGLLRQVQSAESAAGGMESVASGWPDGGMVQRTRDLAAVWSARDTEALTRAAFWTYTALDVALIVAYVALFWALQRRLRPAPPWVAPGRLKSIAVHHPGWVLWRLAAFDVLEDVLRLAIVLPSEEPARGLIWGSWLATTCKWAFLAAALTLIGALVHEARADIAAESRRLAAALWRLRILALPSLAFGALLLADPAQQGPELVRRWLDGGDTLGAAVAAVVGSLLLGAVLWAAARRMVLAPHGARLTPVSQAAILGTAVALAVAAALLDLHRLGGVALVLGAVWAVAAVRRLVKLGDLVDAERQAYAADRGWVDAAAPGDAERGALQRMARVLALWPALALALAMVRSFSAPPLALTSAAGARPWASALLAAAGAGLAVLLVVRGWALLRGLDARPPPQSVEAPFVVLAAACVVAPALAVAWPLQVAPALGTIAILAAAIGTLSLVAAEAQRRAEARPPPIGLQALGFRRTPLIGLVVAVFVAASLVDRDDDYHAVHLPAGPAVAPGGLDLREAWDDWTRRTCASRARSGERRAIPLVIVAASGGGLRAAYWTASSLTALLPDPAAPAGASGCPATRRLDRVFAMSGVSGGSLGLVSYASWAQAPGDGDWYEQALGRPDFLATPATALFVDFARATVGWRGPDRARRLEQAWERHVPGLDREFLRLERAPLLLLGSTKVESGCHLNVSALRLSDRPASSPPRQDECAALTTRSANVGSTRAPAAPATSEVLDYLCAGRARLARSTAALLSARFPYITPSGRLAQCAGGPPETAVVDGGYAENTGVGAAMALWRQLEPLVAAHNRDGGGTLVVPVFVELDNHYAKVAAPGVAGRTDELLTPPLARAHASATGDLEIEQEARSTFLADPPGLAGTRCWLPGALDERTGTALWGRFVRVAPVVSPGLPAPLAWTLSQMSTDDLDRQRERALREREGKALADLLAGTSRLDCSS